MTTRRRQFLRLCGIAGIGAVAGCSDGSDETPTTADATADGRRTTEPSSGATRTSGDTTGAETPQGGPTDDETATPTGTSTDGSTTAKLAAADGDGGDFFGSAVAVSSDGTTALVGAYGGIVSNDETGSASVFAAADGSWVQRATLTAGDGQSGDRFGRSVALSGDGATALVGTPRDDGSTGEGAGSASVFDAGGESWTQRETLTAPDGDGGDSFGQSVGVSDDGATALVGALRDADPNGEHVGSAYVFGL